MRKVAPNRVSIPRFVERFPEYRADIIELRFHDAAFNDLCYDYDEVVQALNQGTGLAATDNNGTVGDLRRIKAELEKVFKVPINKWTATTAVRVGVFGIGLVVLVMNYHHPYSREARLYFYTTPIYSRIDGRIVDVPVERNKPLKKGDVLFRFDPRPFEREVETLRGQIEAVKVERDRNKADICEFG